MKRPAWPLRCSRFVVACLYRHLSIFKKRSKTSDQPGSASECQIGPKPLGCDKHRGPHTDQEVDMREPPKPPCECPRQFDSTKIGDSRVAADGGEIALVPVAERWRAVTAKRGSPDYISDVTTTLFGGRRKTRHCEIAVPSGGG